MIDLFSPASESDAPRAPAVDAFERFWRAYPARQGANPRKPAAAKFNALVKAGVDPERIVAGVLRFAHEERRNVGSRFIPMALTWLNQQRFGDYAPVAAKPDTEFWEATLKSYKRLGIWSRHAGPEPDSPACQCPQDLLAKYGVGST